MTPQRLVTAVIRGIRNAGLDLKQLQVDPTTGTVVADIASGTRDDPPDEIDVILDRRIAAKEKRPSGIAGRAGARKGYK